MTKQLDISKCILQIEKEYCNGSTPDLFKEWLKLQTEFDLLSFHQVEYLLLRTKSNFNERGEKVRKILANQLKGSRAKQLISRVYTDGGQP